jgi:hypothetical protein
MTLPKITERTSISIGLALLLGTGICYNTATSATNSNQIENNIKQIEMNATRIDRLMTREELKASLDLLKQGQSTLEKQLDEIKSKL